MEKDLQFCKEQLGQNPAWVGYIAPMFRKGTCKRLMERERESAGAPGDVATIQARIRRVAAVLARVKLVVLRKVSDSFPQGDLSSEWADAFGHANVRVPLELLGRGVP